MNAPQTCSDKDRLENYLRRCSELNYYHLGDLDDFFWPYTSWFALKEQGDIQALVLLYIGCEIPTVLAVRADNHPEMLALVDAIERKKKILEEGRGKHFDPKVLDAFFAGASGPADAVDI